VLPSAVAKEAGTERKGSLTAPMSAAPPMIRLFALERSKETANSASAPSTLERKVRALFPTMVVSRMPVNWE
jgi:hypothetical protein